MNRNCIQTRKIILETSDLELLTPDLKRAKEHLQECNKCISFFSYRDEFRKFLKENLETFPTPSIVREETLQLITNLCASRKRKKNNTFFFLKNKNIHKHTAIAAVIMIFILSLLLYNLLDTSRSDLTSPGQTNLSSANISQQLIKELVNDYIRYLLSETPIEFATNSPEELNNWFSGKVDFNVRFSSFNNKKLVGGRLCYLFERRVALAFYKNPENTVTSTRRWTSLFIFKDNHIDISHMPTVEIINPAKPSEVKIICKGESKGYELALWKQNGLVYAMVSDENTIEIINELN